MSYHDKVPVKEPHFVTMDRVHGSVMETCSDQLDNKSGISLRIESVPDKSENQTEVSDLSNKNVGNYISGDAEPDEL